MYQNMSPPLDAAIRSLAFSMGADLYGVADLGPARDFISRQGGERIVRYPIAVAVGIRLSDDLVNLLAEHDPEGEILYRHTG